MCTESPNANIGHPKLFIGGAVGRQESPAAPTVNNFAAAPSGLRLVYRALKTISGFPAPTGQVFER